MHATIIDHNEWDRAVLAAAAAPQASAAQRQADWLSAHVARHSTPDTPLILGATDRWSLPPARPTPEEILADSQRRLAARSADGIRYFEQGQQAETEGKLGAARVFYQMAARRAEGEWLAMIETRLAAVSATPGVPLDPGTDRTAETASTRE